MLKQTAKTASYLIVGIKVKLPDHLLYRLHAYKPTSQEGHAAELADRTWQAVISAVTVTCNRPQGKTFF